jgi:hypothetical protein
MDGGKSSGKKNKTGKEERQGACVCERGIFQEKVINEYNERLRRKGLRRRKREEKGEW